MGVKFSWRDLLIMVRGFQADAASATSRAMHGEHWTLTEQLLAALFDLLNFGNWQRAGKKHAPKPKRLTRPWEKPKNQRFGSKPIPISEFDDWWDSQGEKNRGKRLWKR